MPRYVMTEYMTIQFYMGMQSYFQKELTELGDTNISMTTHNADVCKIQT